MKKVELVKPPIASNFVVHWQDWVQTDPTWPEAEAQLGEEIRTGTDENCTLLSKDTQSAHLPDYPKPRFHL